MLDGNGYVYKISSRYLTTLFKYKMTFEVTDPLARASHHVIYLFICVSMWDPTYSWLLPPQSHTLLIQTFQKHNQNDAKIAKIEIAQSFNRV